MGKISVKAVGRNAAEILIYEDIDPFFGVGAKQFAEDLKVLGEIQTINVRINSPGGDVFDGFAIYNTLVKHSAKVIIDIDGMALSIASVIAMAGDEIHMAQNALFMIHDPWSISGGTANEFRKLATLMDQIKVNIRDTYAARTGIDAAEVDAMMEAETWFDADLAKELGFVDSVTPAKSIAAKFDSEKLKFKNMPQELVEKPKKSLEIVVGVKLEGLDEVQEQLANLKKPEELEYQDCENRLRLMKLLP